MEAGRSDSWAGGSGGGVYGKVVLITRAAEPISFGWPDQWCSLSVALSGGGWVCRLGMGGGGWLVRRQGGGVWEDGSVGKFSGGLRQRAN